MDTIYTGQGEYKDCVVGDRLFNRYGVFNGIERPRRIDRAVSVSQLGFDTPEGPITVTVSASAGSLTPDKYYAYRLVTASRKYRRSVAVGDGSLDYVRSNPSSAMCLGAPASSLKAVEISVPGITGHPEITDIFIYRNTAASTPAEALAGPFYYAGKMDTPGAPTTFTDTISDEELGEIVEEDNFPPSTHPYAVVAYNRAFTGGARKLSGVPYTMGFTNGSPTVTLSMYPTVKLYDGIVGWRIRVIADTSGGVDGLGTYYVNYVDDHTLQLVDENDDPKNYDGTTDTSKSVVLYTPGNILRWSKDGELGAYPAENYMLFEGDIMGIGVVPSQALLVVYTDTPAMYSVNLTLVGTASFGRSKTLISTEFTTCSHYSICAVDGKLRAIDMWKGCITETDGVTVRDVTSDSIPYIWDFLDQDPDKQLFWHCAYDDRQGLFGAFVSLSGSLRVIDFCIGQNTVTGAWFFHFEKDLLSTGKYVEPSTNTPMVLGGTEGLPSGEGAVWGRIWAPGIYDEWIPDGSPLSGTVSGVTNSTKFSVTGGGLPTSGDGLKGRWVLVCNANGEYAQVGYIVENTATTITVSGVVGGNDNTQFDPIVAAGWKWYLGLIEVKWGPKILDFGDPVLFKKIWEIWCTVTETDPDNLPFFRLYKSGSTQYERQLAVQPKTYRDGDSMDAHVNQVGTKLEEMPLWAISFHERSHEGVILHDLTIIFNPATE